MIKKLVLVMLTIISFGSNAASSKLDLVVECHDSTSCRLLHIKDKDSGHFFSPLKAGKNHYSVLDANRCYELKAVLEKDEGITEAKTLDGIPPVCTNPSFFQNKSCLIYVDAKFKFVELEIKEFDIRCLGK